MSNLSVLTFYSFVNIEDLELLQPKLLFEAKRKLVKGTIIIAPEGFNATISGEEEAVKYVLDKVIELTGAVEVMWKIHSCPEHPFRKMKVPIKKEIIDMGVPIQDVVGNKGDYIETKDWDEFIQRDDVVVIDTRNDYEVEVGTFKGAINPYTETFKEFPQWVEENKEKLKGKKIAMFCTGGVRCEKSTAYMKEQGFPEAYHLKGGILQYLEDTNNKNSVWQGTCFVFDDRRAVDDYCSPAEGAWYIRDNR